MFNGELKFVNNTNCVDGSQPINNFFFWSFYRIFTTL